MSKRSKTSRDRTKNLAIWVTDSEKAEVDAEMDRLGIRNYSDFIRIKLGLPVAPKGRPPSEDDGE
ncbi:MAG: hypothetical protein H8E27_01670 [Verrucomicrobia subdivision 3 bacterium]|nr:hypothetical protein [Limisphaerales bacterium]